jgi:hypothetical protein
MLPTKRDESMDADLGVSRQSLSLARLADRLTTGRHVIILVKAPGFLQVEIYDTPREFKFKKEEQGDKDID